METMYSREFQAIINFRRSNRSFDNAVEVPDDVIQKSLDRAVLSPNSSNMQLWEFHWIKSKSELEKFVPLCLGQRAASTAKHMVVCVTRHDKWRARAWATYTLSLKQDSKRHKFGFVASLVMCNKSLPI
jgi:nitroreductase